MIRGRIRAYRDAGVTMLGVQPYGRDIDEKLQTVAKIVNLVGEVDAEPAKP